MDDKEIEQEIIEKGLTAPRVTIEGINAKIATELYMIVPETAVTVCAITLKNGFVVTGMSAPASPENYDKELGRKISRAKAFDSIWPLEGYLLKEVLYMAKQHNEQNG